MNGLPLSQIGGEGNRVDSGHTFLYVPSSGAGIGFYPKNGLRGKPGRFEPDNSRTPYTHYMSFRACPETQKMIRQEIQNSLDNTPIYDILDHEYGDETAQCTTWACEVLSNAGIQNVPKSNEPFDLSRQPGMSSR
jgi:hypothetical protein